jgi:hypothetical protein
MELYIGISMSFFIMVGCPTIIGIIIKCIGYKYCAKYDEEREAVLGGMTILEFFTFVFTCGKSLQGKITEEE